MEYNFKANHRSQRNIIVKKGREYILIRIEDIAYFFLDNKICYIIEKKTGNKYFVAKPLREMEMMLNSQDFYRINKKYLINIDAIAKFRLIEKGKVEVILNPVTPEKIFISQVKAQSFKRWIIMGEDFSNVQFAENLNDNEVFSDQKN